jgi:ABC-type branched-subunit amino acid transport system substrate-binding protein
MRKNLVIVLAAAALIATAACGASGGDAEKAGGGEEQATTTTAAAKEAAAGTYGDLEDVCGPGDATVEQGEGGGATDQLNIGVATDRTSTIRPGLNKEMWDASVAYSEWCNAQGGIKGLKINLVELPGALLEVESAMSTACTGVFAMVGGGFAQDNFEFSGKDGSDFHKCGLIDIPGYAVSPEKSDSNGQVQPVPNPATSVATTWMRDYEALNPDLAGKIAIAYASLPALEVVKDKYVAGAEDVGLDVVDTFSFPATGQSDWTPMAQRIIESGATTLLWVGEAGFAASLIGTLKQQGWTGKALLETNMYDPLLFSAGDDAVEGTVLRQTSHPLEEADRWPAIQQYLDTLDEYVPDAKTGPLGVQATSAWLLFAVSAGKCADENDGVIDRTCVLQQADATTEWSGGGLHATVDPASGATATAGECGMLMVVKDGKFERLYPKLDGKGDDGDGFHCPKDGVAEVPANAGKGKVDPSRPI